MPYALFCNDARLSNTYPTEADVWTLARQSGLVVDAASEGEKAHPRPVLDNDYEIRPCRPEPDEDALDRELTRALHPFSCRGGNLNELRERLLDTMWDDVGVVRARAGLDRGIATLTAIEAELLDTGLADDGRAFNMTWHDWLNLRSLTEISRVIALAAVKRENSRGAHFRSDFPGEGDLASSRFTVARPARSSSALRKPRSNIALCATKAASPVSKTVRRPSSRSCRMASRASGRSTSERRIAPIARPERATSTSAWPSVGCAKEVASTPCWASKARFPTRICAPPRDAMIPSPGWY